MGFALHHFMCRQRSPLSHKQPFTVSQDQRKTKMSSAACDRDQSIKKRINIRNKVCQHMQTDAALVISLASQEI